MHEFFANFTVQDLAYITFTVIVPWATWWARNVQVSLSAIKDNTAAHQVDIAVLKAEVGFIKGHLQGSAPALGWAGVGLALLLLGSFLPAVAQQSFTPYPTKDIQFQAPSPEAPKLTLNYSGDPGQQLFTYWVVATYPRGQSSASAPVSQQMLATPTAANPVTLSWNRPAGSTSFSVLRSTTATFPSPCTCLVSTVTDASLVDTGAALTAFTHSPVGVANAAMRLDNSGFATTQFTFDRPFVNPSYATANRRRDLLKASSTGALTLSVGNQIYTSVAFGPATDVETGDSAVCWPVDRVTAGMTLVNAYAVHDAAGTTGSSTIQIRNETQAVDMLTVLLTISTGTLSDEVNCATAGQCTAVTLVARDYLCVDVDTITTTPPTGLVVQTEWVD